MESIEEMLFSHSRDYLLNGEGQKVKYEEGVKGKIIGLFIGPHWLPDYLLQSASSFAEYEEELGNRGVVFVFVGTDRDEKIVEQLTAFGKGSDIDACPDPESFTKFLTKMPLRWLAVPFDDPQARAGLTEKYGSGIFSLAFVGPDGSLHTKEGFSVLEKWGTEGFPFTDERIEQLRQEAAERAANQTLASLLVHKDRDYVVSNTGEQVKVAELEGKIVALYFSAHWCPPCKRFTPFLAKVYNELKEKKAEFEVVFISADENEEAFDMYFKSMPWLAVPFSDESTKKMLNSIFEVEGIPNLVILDAQGKTSQKSGVEIMYKYGAEAYPFTEESLDILKQEEAARKMSQTLEKVLVEDDLDFVISQDNQQVSVASLQGKTVGLYFSAHWCPPCREFTPNLISVYNCLKDGGKTFEVVFISSDRDEEAFKEYYGSMPWLALPYDDKRKKHLSRYFEVQGIPSLVILGPDGKTVTDDGRTLIDTYGEKGFPFTEERIAELEEEVAAEMEKLPKTVTVDDHEHELNLMKDPYASGGFSCDKCGEIGRQWAYHCLDCGYDLHPKCVQEEQKVEGDMETEEHPAGYVCEGDVCRRV